ncbi:hypothetical protein T484DRAFT_1776784 [Baffinella frigidus]|nr:hypothetical protein T484DRAFT_1776784 [Cryptophyta sp. CCMP2293]
MASRSRIPPRTTVSAARPTVGAGRGRAGGASSGTGEEKSTMVMAAAMQDHFMKSLNLGNLSLSGPPRRPIRKTSRPAPELPKPLEAAGWEAVPVKMTLAQKLGLVAAPPARLTQDQWQETAARARGRDDSRDECAICRDAFKAEDQVETEF